MTTCLGFYGVTCLRATNNPPDFEANICAKCTYMFSEHRDLLSGAGPAPTRIVPARTLGVVNSPG